MSGRKIFFGVVLILVGLAFLSLTMRIMWFDLSDIFRFFLPFGLIALGVWLIMRKRRRTFECCRPEYNIHVDDCRCFSTSTRPAVAPSETPQNFARDQAGEAATGFVGDAGPRVSQTPDTDAGDKLRYSKLLGDMYIDLNGRTLESVEMSSGIGDVEIKLHGALLSSGLNRMVISGFIGDIRVFMPTDLPFFASCSNFIGDIELTDRRTSGFGNNIDFQTEDYSSAEKKLYIAAHNFIGDIKVHKV